MGKEGVRQRTFLQNGEPSYSYRIRVLDGRLHLLRSGSTPVPPLTPVTACAIFSPAPKTLGASTFSCEPEPFNRLDKASWTLPLTCHCHYDHQQTITSNSSKEERGRVCVPDVASKTTVHASQSARRARGRATARTTGARDSSIMLYVPVW